MFLICHDVKPKYSEGISNMWPTAAMSVSSAALPDAGLSGTGFYHPSLRPADEYSNGSRTVPAVHTEQQQRVMFALIRMQIHLVVHRRRFYGSPIGEFKHDKINELNVVSITFYGKF